MLLDWVTARVEWQHFEPAVRARLLTMGDRVMRYCGTTGEVRYETFAWDSMRSDSHGVAFRIGAQALWVQGSPARVLGTGCNVFGEGPAGRLDLLGCVDALRGYLGDRLGAALPDSAFWKVSRVDVTGNLLLNDSADVRAALETLRNCEGGRYRVSQQAGDTVYWSHRSKHKKGKAYAKGAHLRYITRQRGYAGPRYSVSDLQACERLLRLELSLGREWFRRRCPSGLWSGITGAEFEAEWASYFGRMIGDSMVTNDASAKERILAVAPTLGRGRAAYGCWMSIQHEGWERAREGYAKPTWYRHLQILHIAGLGDADISVGRVVPLRRRVMVSQVVETWDELRAACAA